MNRNKSKYLKAFLPKIGSWYIIHKPLKSWKPKDKDPLVWKSEMDKFDRGIYQCKEYYKNHYLFNGTEYVSSDCSKNYAFHKEWLEGPFTTADKATQHTIKIKITERHRMTTEHQTKNSNWGEKVLKKNTKKEDLPNELSLTLKEIDKHYDKEINNLINEYHNRNNRREQLNSQISNVFNKPSTKKSLFKRFKPVINSLIWACLGGVTGYMISYANILQYFTF